MVQGLAKKSSRFQLHSKLWFQVALSVSPSRIKNTFIIAITTNTPTLISINLGVVNLLPLPALDGGRIFFVIIEAIIRKPIDKNKEGMFHLIGFVLLLLFMVIVTFSDIKRIFM